MPLKSQEDDRNRIFTLKSQKNRDRMAKPDIVTDDYDAGFLFCDMSAPRTDRVQNLLDYCAKTLSPVLVRVLDTHIS